MILPWRAVLKRLAVGQSDSMPTLNIYFPESRKRWTLRVESQEFDIGRSKECAVTIPHVSVSKRHVRVEFSSGRYRFRDLKSRNGTFINDLPRKTGPLTDGDVLRVGRFEITFYREEPPAGTPSAPSAAELRPTDAISSDIREGADTLVDVKSLPDDLPMEDSDAETTRAGAVEKRQEADTELHRRGPPTAESAAPHGRGGPTPHDNNANNAEAATVFSRTPAEERRSRRSPWPPGTVVAGAIVFLALGILLGYLSARFDSGADSERGKLFGKTAGENDETTEQSVARAVAGSSSEDALFGEADWTDPDTATRVVVRLYLDLVDRPPTREEARQLLAMSVEDRWLTILDQGQRVDHARPRSFKHGFVQLLGRDPTVDELNTLRQEASEDLDEFLYRLARSKAYAAAARQRQRSESQLALSLVTNLLNAPPNRAKRKVSLELLKEAKGDLAQAVDALLKTVPESVAPGKEENPAEWIGDMFYLMLLRPPRSKELEKHEKLLAQDADGWKNVLRALALHEEYLVY